jgi:hypothetical protein
MGACDRDQYVLPINASASVCWSERTTTGIEPVAWIIRRGEKIQGQQGSDRSPLDDLQRTRHGG